MFFALTYNSVNYQTPPLPLRVPLIPNVLNIRVSQFRMSIPSAEVLAANRCRRGASLAFGILGTDRSNYCHA